MMEDKIKKFWEWFSKNESMIAPDKITNALVDKLNDMILSMGDYDWEIREGKNKENMLIISPGGDPDLLESTQEIIKLSPNLKKWEFEYYKPAKAWDYRFSIDDGGLTRMIDASDWEYVLLKFPGSNYDIIIKADSLKVLPEKYHFSSLNIILESILGEKKRLELIENIDLVTEFPEEYINQKGSIKFLNDQLSDLEEV
ncbi:hypothetical protein [uncultured Flavobacterium sp.]|uniref:hypothetical protein n=1 Tax=uncultured Flavobacterium sp. TaxID=165435 RepID=UPI0025DF9B17|nr:hypothetical protein [uncultured Flavobacterium sp.]